MHRLLTRLLAFTAFLCAAGPASAPVSQNPPCPDSVTFKQIQDVLAPCHPNFLAPADTIGETRSNIPGKVAPYDNPFGGGLGGIITGFDPIATGFDAFIQN